MTKEITKAIIIQEIQDKFKLRELIPEKFSFGESVIPVYEIGRHVKYVTAQFQKETVTATGSIVFFTVPENQKWSLQRYDVVFEGAGAYTITGVFVTRKNNLGGNIAGSAYNYLDFHAGRSASYIGDLKYPVDLVPGDMIKAMVDGYTSDQGLRIYIDYVMEEIR